MATKTVSTVGVSGQSNVDSLLSDLKWGTTALTYSFRTIAPTGSEYAMGFASLSETQKTAVREALAKWAAVCNLTFTEVTDSAASTLRFGTCSSVVVPTSEAYYPSTSSSGGNVWFGNSNSNAPTNPVTGSYSYLTIIHEIGHALGLKHPHEADGVFPIAASSIDAMQYSVMSYRSYVGGSVDGGYTNGSGSYATSPMLNDIAAVQYLYGANYSYNSGNTSYLFDPNTTKLFQTIWDGGGIDTYDCSRYSSALTIDLAPGAWCVFSAGQIADLGEGNSAPGNVQNAYMVGNNAASLIEYANGGSGNDTISGNQANNALRGGAGNDQLAGRSGNDQLWGGLGDDVLTDGDGSNVFWWGSSEGNDTVTATTGKDALLCYNFAFSDRSCTFDAAGGLTFGCKTGTADKITLAGWLNQSSAGRVQNLVFKDDGVYKDYAWNYHAPVVANLSDAALSLINVHYLECVDDSNATLRGSSGNDTLKGGAGSDLLWAAAGDDVMTGGIGTDNFYWGQGDGNDAITDGAAGEAVLVYTAGLTTANVSASLLGTTMRLSLATGNQLDIYNWSSAGLNRFTFGMSATASNTYSLVENASGYSWLLS